MKTLAIIKDLSSDRRHSPARARVAAVGLSTTHHVCDVCYSGRHAYADPYRLSDEAAADACTHITKLDELQQLHLKQTGRGQRPLLLRKHHVFNW